MRDPRLTPVNSRVAARSLEGQIPAPRYSDGTRARVTVPVADLLRHPEGPRDRQVLLGTGLTIFDIHEGWAFVQIDETGYVGYLPATQISETAPAPSHVVATRGTHAYASDDMKSADLVALPFGAQLRVQDERRSFYETDAGFVPKRHLRPLDQPFTDPVPVAMLFFGTPYLWGGDSAFGIDCSGLIHAALGACAIPCPGDSDQQEAALGSPIADAPRRGDLIFWKGHVGLLADDTTLLHANAHHMAVTYEPFEAAKLRIEAQGDGPVTSLRRLG